MDSRVARPCGPTISAFLLYLAWSAATWFFEGRLETLLRPDAVVARALYVVLANMAVGTVGALWLLRRFRPDATDGARHGFASPLRTAISVAAGLGLGFAAYWVQGAPSRGVLVIINSFAQTLTVSIPEILVCWALVGATLEERIALPSKIATVVAALAASLLFGLYHLGHSPPFNTAAMIALLSLVGLATSLFFFVSRDIYGTIVFHNFLATFGVIQALAAQGALAHYTAPQPPLYVMAALGSSLLMVLDRLWLRADPVKS